MSVSGKVEVGLVAARGLFGSSGTTLVTLVLCVSLLASASAMTIAGPRVYYALGRDYPSFGFFSKSRGGRGVPITFTRQATSREMREAAASIRDMTGPMEDLIVSADETMAVMRGTLSGMDDLLTQDVAALIADTRGIMGDAQAALQSVARTSDEDRVWMTAQAVDNVSAALTGRTVPHVFA